MSLNGLYPLLLFVHSCTLILKTDIIITVLSLINVYPNSPVTDHVIDVHSHVTNVSCFLQWPAEVVSAQKIWV